MIQQAISQVMGLIFDPLFSESSCGFRPGRSAHDGVRQVKQYIEQGYTVAVDTDLKNVVSLVLYLYVAKSGGEINPFWSSSGAYVSSQEGAGLFPWNTDIGG